MFILHCYLLKSSNCKSLFDAFTFSSYAWHEAKTKMRPMIMNIFVRNGIVILHFDMLICDGVLIVSDLYFYLMFSFDQNLITIYNI